MLPSLSGLNGTRRRVVVTGLGLVSPLGIGIEPNWEKLVAGRSGIGKITRFDASPLPSRVAGGLAVATVIAYLTLWASGAGALHGSH